MPIYVPREEADLIVQQTRLAIQRTKAEAQRKALDVVTHMERVFYCLREDGSIGLIRLEPFQKAVLLCAFPPEQVGFRYTLVTLSSVKKAGKTTLSAGVARWVGEERTHFGEIYFLGNDGKQARERSFAKVRQSIQMTPGFRNYGSEGILPDRWQCQATRMECLTTSTTLQALAVDASGEAGGNPDLTVWTELWGMESNEAKKFYNELTPVPTKPSCRLIDSYAGYEDGSELLHGVFDQAMEEGRQLTAGELEAETGIPLGGFNEMQHPVTGERTPVEGPDDLVPIWVNEEKRFFCFWDSGPPARRMRWIQGEAGRVYYSDQASKLRPPQEFNRLHENVWVGSEGEFIPLALWDACEESLPRLEPGDRTPAVLGVDAGVSNDYFGVVLVTRHPHRPDDVAIRKVQCWKPPKGGQIEFADPENFIRLICRGGCIAGHAFKDGEYSQPDTCEACRSQRRMEPYNILEVSYDHYQLVDMMQRLYRDGINCQAFSQARPRWEADKQLYDLILNRRLSHTGQADLREHIQNAAAKSSRDEDSKMRMIKKAEHRKIDLAVAASMACHRILYFQLSK